jgi:hypothetical protein
MSESSGIPARIGKPAYRALAAKGITELGRLTKFTENELLAMHGVGPKAVAILRDALAETGMSFLDGTDRSAGT